MSLNTVMAGHSASKTRVNALETRPSIIFAKKMDARVKPAHDVERSIVDVLVHGHVAAPPVGGGAHPFGIGAVAFDELLAQSLGDG